MSSLPSLSPSSGPAASSAQTRSVMPDDHGTAPGTAGATPGTAGATNDRSAASGEANAISSFESALEAQVGALSGKKGASLLEPAADHVPSDAETEKSKQDAADSAVGPPILPFVLPINAPLTQPLPGNAFGNARDAVLSAGDSRQGNGGRWEPLGQSRADVLAEALRSGPGMTQTEPSAAGESRSASFADLLQSLPSTDRPSKQEGDLALASQAGTTVSVAAAPIIERPLDAAQAPQQSNTAIPGTLGEPGWGNAFSQRVSWMVGQQVQSAEFRVVPPQLGPIEVRLSIANDQASLTFVAPHAAAREAIQMSLPRLQEMLMESGVSLGNVFVGSQMPQSQDDTGARERALAGASQDVGAIAGTNSSGINTSLATGRLLGLVDLYA